jgi:hypothetical protein
MMVECWQRSGQTVPFWTLAGRADVADRHCCPGGSKLAEITRSFVYLP